MRRPQAHRIIHATVKATIVTASLTSGVASAHALRQKVAGYRDNQGLSRERLSLNTTVDAGAGKSGLSDSNFQLLLQRDQYRLESMEERKYEEEIYGSSFRVNNTATLGANQTWDKITETRVMGSYQTDGEVRARSFSGGASQWLNHETVRLSFDVSRTIVERPLFAILDFDSETVAEPTLATSTGASVGLRHLATPTTIVDYGTSRVESVGRPASQSGTVAVRQFLPPLRGALHAGALRALNRGYISNDTTYGQVDAVSYDAAYLQNLWRGALARVGYRYYKEDETTRAYADEKVFGSDTISAGLSQELPKGAVDGLSQPLTVEISGARYLTNTGIAATTGELGVTARF